MQVNRRDALRATGLAAGAVLLPGMLGTDVARARVRSAQASGTSAPGRRPWYELGLMADPVLDQVLLFYLGATYQGQADIGEVLDTAHRIDATDESSWAREWEKTASRLRASGAKLAHRGHRRSGGEAFMRASTYYRAALHRYPHQHADPRVKPLTRRAVDAFAAAVELMELPARRVRIPYRRTTLPGWWFRAPVRGRGRPLLMIHNGRDAWAEDGLYLAEAANLRGYDCLLFEGPGMGKVLRLRGLTFRHDWEKVVTPVLDFALDQPGVDRRRVGLMGISMGGALAPRAAAFERRLKVLVANPGVLSWANMIDGQMRQFLGEDLYGLMEADPAAFDRGVEERMRTDAFLRWGVTDMAWKHGIFKPSALLRSMRAYDNTEIAHRIRARTLVMDGTGDPWAQGKPLYDALKAPKDYMLFTAEDTGLMHVQNGALAVGSQRLMDWLEENL